MSTHILAPSEALVCRLKASKCELKVFGKRPSRRLKGVKTILFYLCRSPRIWGPMRGSGKGRAVARKPLQHFLMSVVRLKTLFLGNRDAKLASDPHTQPETGRLLYATSAITSTDALDRAHTLLRSVKGLSVCLNSHAHPRPPPKR
ncbi:hypothetical protein TNIN_317411 [Trichonephila inaurata madagascariensis]|uniref:Uncharacterized protein n=1 Tax=Trichonephila inaurata madagascariensis TaxID=2747483 RepID=A0A8X7CIA3_9ARAC|nr:hypothetical protein TNIN_317411 [Trichonephila inaurata madagascariensis]